MPCASAHAPCMPSHVSEDRAGRAVADRVFINDGALDDIVDALADELCTGGAA